MASYRPMVSKLVHTLRSRPWATAASIGYVGLNVSLGTGVYYPFTIGPDRSWLAFVVFAAAQVALGALWRSWWALALPMALAVAGLIVAEGGLATFFVVVGFPIACL